MSSVGIFEVRINGEIIKGEVTELSFDYNIDNQYMYSGEYMARSFAGPTKLELTGFLSNITIPKGEGMDNYGTLSDKIVQLDTDKDTKLLKEYGVIDSTGVLTGEGKSALVQILFEENKEKFLEKIRAIKAAEKKDKK